MATSTDTRCIHCDAAPGARELSEGWCDSCGKRLPGGPKPAAAAAPEAPVTPAGGGGWRVAVWGGVAFALLGVAAAFAAAAS